MSTDANLKPNLYLRSRGVHRPIMPLIIQGQYRKHRYPGNDLFQYHCTQLGKAFANVKDSSPKRTRFARVFGVLESRSDVFDHYPKSYGKLVHSLIQVAAQEDRWVRDPETWVPDDLDIAPARQLGSFLNHLTTRYSVPKFFLSVFDHRDWISRIEYQWYLDIASGKNIRNSANLPLELSKKAAHHVLQAPSDLSICDALMWGKLRSVVSDPRLINELMRTQFVSSMIHNYERWPSLHPQFGDHQWIMILAQLFERTNNLNYSDVGIIVDYVERHLTINLKGRTMAALKRDADEWHASLYTNHQQSYQLQSDLNWQPAKNIKGRFFFIPGPDKCFWQIKELCSGNQLIEEGQQMQHCVATYISSCYAGNSSIWALHCTTTDGEVVRGATIEVRQSSDRWQIIQARARYNAKPDPELLAKIIEWAEANEIDASVISTETL